MSNLILRSGPAWENFRPSPEEFSVKIPPRYEANWPRFQTLALNKSYYDILKNYELGPFPKFSKASEALAYMNQVTHKMFLVKNTYQTSQKSVFLPFMTYEVKLDKTWESIWRLTAVLFFCPKFRPNRNFDLMISNPPHAQRNKTMFCGRL